MPVDFEEYTDEREERGIRLTAGSNAYGILSFLVDDPGLGFTPKEIGEETGIPGGAWEPP